MVVSAANMVGFGALALGMALTPGPNMLYLVGRSISQGRPAGLLSLVGVVGAFIVMMLAAALGLTALLMAVPLAYDAIRIAGACYLLYLAWKTVAAGGSPFAPRSMQADSPRRLIAMGFFTNILNPKAVVLYLALLPQFVDPHRGSVLSQSLLLCSVQIAISAAVNATMILLAGELARFLTAHPRWERTQRWLMATVLGALAVRMATDARR